MDISGSKILVVDDVPDNIRVAMSYLSDLDCTLYYATSGDAALKAAAANRPDLVLLDVMMPNMDGYMVARHFQESASTRHLPVIFLTAKADDPDVARGFEAGAVDYITKPFTSTELLSRVRTHLELSAYRTRLQEQVERRTRETEKLKDTVIVALAELAEYRDPETGSHIKRTQHYVRAIAEWLRRNTAEGAAISDNTLKMLYKSAALHDIGKVAINDAILLKSGPLTAEEFEIMKRHAEFGEDVIRKLEEQVGESSFLQIAKEIAGGHHEWYDGSGYPRGLRGEQIPLSARIMAIADIYDALISSRVYKQAWSHEDAVREIVKARGTQLDPMVLDAFLAIEKEIQAIANTYRDNTARIRDTGPSGAGDPEL